MSATTAEFSFAEMLEANERDTRKALGAARYNHAWNGFVISFGD